MVNYLARLKTLTDQLAAVGELVSHRDYLAYLLEGLPEEYDSFVTAVYDQVDQLTVEDVQSLLLSYELLKRGVCYRI